MTVRWTFSDTASATPVTYSLDVNPNNDAPIYQKNMQYESLLVPGSLPLLFEAADNPTVFNVQGTLLSENQYQQLLYFYNLRHQFLCTDDLGVQRWIYLTEFQPVRTPNALYKWKMTYTLSGYVISQTLPALGTPPAPGASAPTVTSISPTLGSVNGGTTVTITGTNFVGTSTVTFGGVPVTFNVQNSTTIQATSPSGTAGVSVHVQVQNAGVFSYPTSADLFTFQAAPTVTAVSPTSGPDTGGQQVVIAGTGFTGATAVKFGATAATSFTVNSSTQITATTPAEADATIDVQVTTPVGTSSTSSADHYTFSPPDQPSLVLMN